MLIPLAVWRQRNATEGVPYSALPRSIDHWAKNTARPIPHGTPRMTQRFAGAAVLLRRAAACETPRFRALAICWPSSAGGTGGPAAASVDPAAEEPMGVVRGD